MKKILSIVIPSYNVDKYLRKGISTMLNTEVDDQIEILIIDDGSKDDTFKMASEYESKYPGIVKAIHKENGGHGSTINKGIELAEGVYFYLVDADDWVITENFVRLVKVLSKEDCDLVLTNADIVDETGKKTGAELIKGLPNNKTVYIKDYFCQIPNIEMHNYCIRTNILKEQKITCHENHFYVDNEYTMYPLPYIQTVKFINMPVYQYLVGRIGQSVSIKRRRELLEQYKDIVYYLYFYFKECESKMSIECRTYFLHKMAYFVSGVYSTLMSYQSREKKVELVCFDQTIKTEMPEVYGSNSNLCIAVLRNTNFSLYSLTALIYCLVKGIRE